MSGLPYTMQSVFNGEIGSPFAKLRALLAGVEPGLTPAIDLTLGEPREAMPAGIDEVLKAASLSLAQYPTMRGSVELRQAIAGYIERRYGDTVSLDIEREILPCNGSREGLFYACFVAAARKQVSGKPVVLMCNPFYQAYFGAALASGCEPIVLNAPIESGYLPDLDALEHDVTVLERTVAFYLCSPSNPQGAIADQPYLHRAIALARRWNFMLFVDECYAEIYSDSAPPGGLAIARQSGSDFKNVVVFHSLSKRSNLPGLRSGFSAGDGEFHDQLFALRNFVGPQMPGPVQQVSAEVWNDDEHVAVNRAAYQAKFDLCDRLLEGKFSYHRPAGGFFLWLDMHHFGSDSEVAVTLWKRFGVKVVPGALLAQSNGEGINPGTGHVRVALVQDLATLQQALERIICITA